MKTMKSHCMPWYFFSSISFSPLLSSPLPSFLSFFSHLSPFLRFSSHHFFSPSFFELLFFFFFFPLSFFLRSFHSFLPPLAFFRSSLAPTLPVFFGFSHISQFIIWSRFRNPDSFFSSRRHLLLPSPSLLTFFASRHSCVHHLYCT